MQLKLSSVHFSFFVASLVLAETILPQQATYVLSNDLSLAVTTAILVSLTVGTFVGTHPLIKSWNWRSLYYIHATCLTTAIVGIKVYPSMSWLWLFISFIGAGIFVCQMFARADFSVLLLAIGMGSMATSLSTNFLYRNFSAHVVIIPPLLALAGAGLVLRSKHRRAIFSYLLVCGTLTLILLRAPRNVPSCVETYSPGLVGSFKIAETVYTPLFLTDLVRSTRLNQNILITNGSRFSPVAAARDLRVSSQPESFHPTYDTPFIFRRPKNVLVIGTGGGRSVAAALKYQAQKIYALDINENVFRLIKKYLSGEATQIYDDPRVIKVIDEGRHFIETTHEKFDLIVLQGVQTGTHSANFNPIVLESHLFTVEALRTLWDHLTAEGMIFFDEYRFMSGVGNRSVLNVIASSAKQTLKLDGFSEHAAFFSYVQSLSNISVDQNPDLSRSRMREVLILSRSPIERENEKLIREMPGLVMTDFTSGYNVEIPTDNRPYFIRPASRLITLPALGLAVVLLAAANILIFRQPATMTVKMRQNQLFFMGVAYMLFVMAMYGIGTLFLGPPQLTMPVIYSSLLFFATVGGLWALRHSIRSMQSSCLILMSYLFVLPIVVTVLKSSLIGNKYLIVRIIAVSIMVGIGALIAEVPYVLILQSFSVEGDRAWGFSVGKLGALVGLLLGIYINLYFGFSCALLVSGTLYFIAAKNEIIVLLIPRARHLFHNVVPTFASGRKRSLQ